MAELLTTADLGGECVAKEPKAKRKAKRKATAKPASKPVATAKPKAVPTVQKQAEAVVSVPVSVAKGTWTDAQVSTLIEAMLANRK